MTIKKETQEEEEGSRIRGSHFRLYQNAYGFYVGEYPEEALMYEKERDRLKLRTSLDVPGFMRESKFMQAEQRYWEDYHDRDKRLDATGLVFRRKKEIKTHTTKDETQEETQEEEIDENEPRTLCVQSFWLVMTAWFFVVSFKLFLLNHK